MHNFPILALDFETYYAQGYSLTTMTTKDYILDPRFKVHGVGVRYVHEPKEATRWISGAAATGAFIRSIDWDNTAVLCQNANFDVFILMQHYKVNPAFVHDTAAMGRMREPNHKCGLDEMAKRYLGLEKGKELIRVYGISDLSPELDRVLGGYCVQDVDLMIDIYNYLLPFIPWDMQRLTDIAVRLHTDPKFVLDAPRVTAYRDKEFADSQAKVEASGLPKTALSSNDKFAAHLKSLGIDVPMKEGKNGPIPALAKNDLQFQDLQAEYPEFQDLWDARIAAKSRIGETRAQRFLDARMPNGTIPMPLKVAGAHTFRFSGFDSMNVQNMPRGGELRKSLKAPHGMLVCVIDLSQIEPRTNAWLAGQEDVLDTFREGGDVYAMFGGKLYGRPINRTIDIEEGQVAKVAVLQLGYGSGWVKFARVMRAGSMGPKVNISDADAERTVQVWRSENFMITRLWETCKSILFRMMDRNAQPYTYGPLEVTRERVRLPSGLSLHYPGLKYEDGEFLYFNHKGKYWKRIYGAALDENCIAENTEILTDAGWKPIQLLLATDKVWDGVEFVNHSGLLYKGLHCTVQVDGVAMTPDHKVLTKQGWKDASSCKGLYRADFWLPDGTFVRGNKWTAFNVEFPLQVRSLCKKKRGFGRKVRPQWCNPKLWVQAVRPENARNDQTPGVRSLPVDARSMRATFASGVAQLRRTWDYSLSRLAYVRRFLGRYGAQLQPETYTRSYRQQQRVQQNQLPLGFAPRAEQQPPRQSSCRHTSSGAKNRNRPDDTLLSLGARPVYDIVNAGPRSRFMVRGTTAPFVVHNCVQSLANVVITEAILRVQPYLRDIGGAFVLQVHDELVFLIPEKDAEIYAAQLKKLIITNPDWCQSLPIAAGKPGIAPEYSK